MFLTLAVFLGASIALAADEAPPNLVFILADDLGYGDLGCYGQEKIATPHLDQMAAEGIRFTQHYSGHNVCAPTRCALMTGLHMGRAYVRGNRQAPYSEGQLPIPDEALTIAEVLGDAGYASGMFGKWGLGNPGTTGDPLKQGWDTYFGYTDQIRAHNYFPDFLLKDGKRLPLDNEVKYLSKSAWHKGIGSYSTKQKTYSHDLIVEAAFDFVREHQDDPFFLYLPFTLPHDNGEAPKLQMEVPDFGRYASREGWSPNSKGYAEMVTRLDASVGQLLALLEELGLRDNTLVLFTSDNGPIRNRDDKPDRQVTKFFASSAGFRGTKGEFYEGGIRVPLIAQWPGKIAPGVITDHLSAHWDFFPTACELAGIAVPNNLDGLSYLPTLLSTEEGQKQHEYLYWEGGPKQSVAIRWGKWKAVIPDGRRLDEPVFEVYDLESDPAETTDLGPQNPDLQAAFRQIMSQAHEPSPHFPLFID